MTKILRSEPAVVGFRLLDFSDLRTDMMDLIEQHILQENRLFPVERTAIVGLFGKFKRGEPLSDAENRAMEELGHRLRNLQHNAEQNNSRCQIASAIIITAIGVVALSLFSLST